MPKPKFKVGDKVKVLRAPTDEEYDLWRDSWVGDMNGAIGNEYTISHYITREKNFNEYIYKYYLDGRGFCFPEFVLQKVNEVGKQLLFSFMGE